MCKIFHLSAKLISNVSETDKEFRPIHKSIIMNIKKFSYQRVRC